MTCLMEGGTTPPQPTFDISFQDRLADLIAWRRDVRRFRREPVADVLVGKLLQLANLSPSVGNSQPWRWVRIDSPEARRTVITSFESANTEASQDYDGAKRSEYLALKLAGLREAPVHLAVFCDEATAQGTGLGRRTMPETLRYSAVCSVHTFWLAARSHGLGVGWVSILDPDAVTTALDVPKEWRLVAYLCVGWPKEEHDDPELQRARWQTRQPMTVYTR